MHAASMILLRKFNGLVAKKRLMSLQKIDQHRQRAIGQVGAAYKVGRPGSEMAVGHGWLADFWRNRADPLAT